MRKRIPFIIFMLIMGVASVYIVWQQTAGGRQSKEAATVEWQTYRNDELGFSIDYPKFSYDYGADCDNAEGKYRYVAGMIPTAIFEKNNTVRIFREYEVIMDENKQNCQKEYFSAEDLDSPDNPWQLSWQLVFKEVINQDELNEFVGQYYGQSCQLEGLTSSSQAGVYDVNVYYDGQSLDESDCFLNYQTVMKYYPEKNMAVAWNIGQEEVFWSEGFEHSFDQLMIQSFRFINNN